MAHEISIRSNGQAEAAYAIKPAWHGLGKVLDFVPNSEAMIEAAGLDWNVSLRRMTAEGGLDCGDYRCTVRDDTNEVFFTGLTKGYGVVQNREQFKFLDSLWQDGIMKYESAMALKGGRIVVVVARMPGYDTIAEGDTCNRYVMFQTSHDGKMKLHAIPTSVRVVCMNTLRMAIQGMEGIRHSGDMNAKLNYLRKHLSQFDSKFTLFRDSARRLSEIKIDPPKCLTYIDTLIPPVQGDKTSRAKTIRDAKVSAIWVNYGNSRNAIPSIKGTYWGIFNAVSELVDHGTEMRFVGQGRERTENRYLNLVGGDGAAFKEKAFTLAKIMANVS